MSTTDHITNITLSAAIAAAQAWRDTESDPDTWRMFGQYDAHRLIDEEGDTLTVYAINGTSTALWSETRPAPPTSPTPREAALITAGNALHFALTEAHEAETQHDHHGDGEAGCSYCAALEEWARVVNAPAAELPRVAPTGDGRD